MDNKYTFKDFLADLGIWQSGHLSEYYKFLGLLGQEELRIVNVFFALVKQMSVRVPRLVVEDDVRIPHEMADIIKRSHTIERMVKEMGYSDPEPFLMSLLYWIYYDHSYEWIYSKIKNPIRGYNLGIFQYPLNLVAKTVVKRSLKSGMRTQDDWDKFWSLQPEMKQLPYDELFKAIPNDVNLLEDGCDSTPMLPEPTIIPNKQFKPLSEILRIQDKEFMERILGNIRDILMKKSKGPDLILLLVALKSIIISPETSPLIGNRLEMTEYREALSLEYPDLEFVHVRTIQRAYKDLFHKDAKGKRVIENSWFTQELAYMKAELLK